MTDDRTTQTVRDAYEQALHLGQAVVAWGTRVRLLNPGKAVDCVEPDCPNERAGVYHAGRAANPVCPAISEMELQSKLYVPCALCACDLSELCGTEISRAHDGTGHRGVGSVQNGSVGEVDGLAAQFETVTFPHRETL